MLALGTVGSPKWPVVEEVLRYFTQIEVLKQQYRNKLLEGYIWNPGEVLSNKYTEASEGCIVLVCCIISNLFPFLCKKWIIVFSPPPYGNSIETIQEI